MHAESHLNSLDRGFIADSPIESTVAPTAPIPDYSTDDVINGAPQGTEWRVLIRDITAVANSGGGQITLAAPLDEQELRRRLAEHTQGEFADIAVHPLPSTENPAFVMTVGPALFPISFSEFSEIDGCTLPAIANRATAASSSGFYFRHGERTERATTADMRSFIERLLGRVQRRWLQRMRRTVSRPLASLVAESHRTARKGKAAENLQPVRIVTDPNAPALQPQDVDRLYPWRQKDLLRELNTRLGRRMLNSYDIQAVRRQHKLDERPDFVFNLPGAGRRYSPAAAEWIMEEYTRDPEFFHRARAADHELMNLRRAKPK
jgi:hypothetical protein